MYQITLHKWESTSESYSHQHLSGVKEATAELKKSS